MLGVVGNPRFYWWRIRSGDMEVEGKDRGGLLTRLWRGRWRLHQDSKPTACRPIACLIWRSGGFQGPMVPRSGRADHHRTLHVTLRLLM